MEANIARVTGKGQISLPIRMRKSLGITHGDSVLLVSEGDAIVIKRVGDQYKDLVHHAEKVARELWSNKEDDIWDNI